MLKEGRRDMHSAGTHLPLYYALSGCFTSMFSVTWTIMVRCFFVLFDCLAFGFLTPVLAVLGLMSQSEQRSVLGVSCNRGYCYSRKCQCSGENIFVLFCFVGKSK